MVTPNKFLRFFALEYASILTPKRISFNGNRYRFNFVHGGNADAKAIKIQIYNMLCRIDTEKEIFFAYA